MRKLLLVVLVGLLALAMFAPGAQAAPFEPVFAAHLDGASEVPPVATRATGEALFGLEGTGPNGTTMPFRLAVRNIDHVMAAHIHLGCSDEEGPVVVTLFSGGPTGTVNGVLAAGRITRNDLEGPMAGRTVAQLARQMRGGCTYVNVHTTEWPGGEIRGQVGAVH